MSDKTSKIKILPYTIKVRMDRITLLRKATWFKEYADEHGLDIDLVDAAIARFVDLSVRVKNLKGVADFELVTPQDSPDEFRQKFEVYLESNQVILIDTIREKIEAMDKPNDEDNAPNAILELFEGED